MLWTALLPLRHLRPRPCFLPKATLKNRSPGSYFSLRSRVDTTRHQHSDSTVKRGIPKPWLPDQEDELFRLREQGLNLRSIAEKLQRGYLSIKSRLNRPQRHERAVTRTQNRGKERELERLKAVMGHGVKEEGIQSLATELDRPPANVKARLVALRKEHGLSDPRPARSQKPWTQEELDLAKRMSLEGKSVKEIGTILYRSRTSVSCRLRYELVTGKSFNPNYFVSPSDVQQILKYYSEGKSAKQIHRLMPTRSRNAIHKVIVESWGHYVAPASRGEVKAK